jgi:ketosteroid isomerase-like protein
MSSGGQNAALAREAVEAFQRGDIEAFVATLDPRVDVFCAPELPNAGRFEGRNGFTEWSSQWFEAWERFEVEPEAFEPVGDHHVLIPVRQSGRGRGSGVEVEMRACYMAEYHEGLATRFHLYADREEALAAAREGECS